MAGVTAIKCVSLVDKVLQAQAAYNPSSPSSSLSLRAYLLRSFECSPTPDVRAFSPSPPLGFLDP